MNPYALLAAGGVWIGSIAAAGWWAYGAGRDAELATQAREDRAAVVATDAAASAAANAISHIEVKNVQIRQPLETIVRTETVFRDCRSGPDALRLLNSTPGIAAAASAADDGQLPASGPAH
ncbi:hypothetical protein SNE35_28590 [Paucibacter sp. R3-3]|uniref:Uncharacterized protein n=1 Tax=Roseateles agri TaxID=3098619 RepID=A0ABU5DQ82_9BURK|nr:hypothetical protein [Paucibacter sp. R3-3]MDY0748492.1 hypothetical protein [Paucibacter sp. R3-3]